MIKQTFRAKGHPNVLATHSKTLEISTEDFLTPRGDCIIAIESEIPLNGLEPKLKDLIRKGSAVTITINCNGASDKIIGYGHPELTLESDVSMVIRRSQFKCPRTLCINADKTSADLNRQLIEELKKGGDVKIEISVSSRKAEESAVSFF